MNWLLITIFMFVQGTISTDFTNDFNGTWKCTHFHLTLKYNKGKDQVVHMPDGFESTLIFKSTGLNKGTVLSKTLGTESQGTWQFSPVNARLEIQYKTEDQMVYLYRKVSWKGKTLVLTADDAMVLQQYRDNQLMDQGMRKLIGGQIVEEYSR